MGDLNTTQSLADQFTYQSTTFLNQINVHPDDAALSTYGMNIIPLAAKLGIAGIKLVTNHHLALARLKSDHSQHLLWTSVPYPISITPKPNNKLAITINKPKRKFTLRWPDLNELRRCFYSLLSIAIVGHWKDRSQFTPSQIRFLMRLSGLKLVNANQLRKVLQKFIKVLSQAESSSNVIVQRVCHRLPTIFTTSNRGKLNVIINLLKEEDLNNLKYYKPLLMAKLIYVRQILMRLPPKKRQRLTNQPGFNNLSKIPSNDYITMDNNYGWHSLTNYDVINFLNALIFYLE